jgi:hypothetical protein
MEPTLPFAEGPNGDLWFMAYREHCGRVTVLAYEYRKTPETKNAAGVVVTAGVTIGACVWGATRKGDRWVGTIGKPGDRGLAMAAGWLKKNDVAG